MVSLAIASCTGLVLWRGSLLILAGTMTAGALTVFLAYLAKFFQPVRDLAQMTNTIAQVSVAFERVLAVSEADSVIPERPAAIDPPPFRGEITFEHVGIRLRPGGAGAYATSASRSNPAQMVGIVGPTGSGKSTIVSLIPRFRDADTGTITIDGVDIRDYTLHGLRAQIGFVLQDTVLLRGTVRDNIAFGRPDATEDEIVHAAKLANARRVHHAHAPRLRQHGRRSRFDAVGRSAPTHRDARALIRDNPILILDEPTAALDAESEASGDRSHGTTDGRPHRHHHRPSSEHPAQRGQNHRHQGRRRGRTGHPRRAAQLGRRLRPTAPPAVRPACLTRHDSRAREQPAPSERTSSKLPVNG